METFYTVIVSKVLLVYFCGMNEELQNILHKVRLLFMKYGIKSITMDDVAREIGISKKTLYQYVENKNDLLNKVLDMELEESECNIEKVDNSGINAIEALFIVLKFLNMITKEYSSSAIYDLKKYYPDLYNKMNRLRREKIYNRVIKNLNKGIEEGFYRKDINEQLIAKIQVERMENAIDSDYLSIEELSTPDIFLEIFKYHIRGIATEKGLKELDKEIEKLKTNNIN
jgi:TetR/AcrR family transcriptional regulator, cholesterol catabolism regulator